MNWTTLTIDTVKTGKRSEILASVLQAASLNGDPDPTGEMIADVTAQIRAAISSGNQLDQDPTKIPNSLKGLALRMMTRRLKDYIELPLSADELKQATDDANYLKQISTMKVRFETPDAPAGSAEQQENGPMLEQQTGAATEGECPTKFNRKSMDGL